MNAFAQKLPRRNELSSLRHCLQRIQILNSLKDEELDKMLAVMKKRIVPAGVTVYRQGDKADAFYLVASGRLSVWQRNGFQSGVIASVRDGQYFGDNSLLHDSRHSCSVVAETHSELYVLYKADFEAILMANQRIADAIKAHVSEIRTGTHG